MIQITQVDQSVAFAALKNGIQDERLGYDIRKDRPQNLAKLVSRVQNGIEVEEATNPTPKGEGNRKRKKESASDHKPKQKFQKGQEGQKFQPWEYTPLNAPKHES